MSKPIIPALAVAILTAAGISGLPVSGVAADLPTRHGLTLGCGRCGCLHVSYVYHRELESTYGLNFDPRNFDQTEPFHYLGRLKAYPRYWVDADQAQ
jgi:hypothetical protein